MKRSNRTRPRRVFRRKRSRILPVVLGALVLGGAATGGYLFFGGKTDEELRHEELVEILPKCEVPREILQTVRNGYYPGRSGDVLAVEELPNQFGTRHSSPHDYTQEVPIILYGPGFINARAEVDRPVTVADLASTYAELLNFDAFPTAEREGKPLTEALLPEAERNGVPKLIFTLVWDGGGDNVLERWPDAWPNLQGLIDNGTHFSNATVGSSPSITPSIHANIGTGAFPQTHGIPDTRIRVKGKMVDAWEQTSPQYLEVDTIGDMYDVAMGNEPLVGMMARDAWHLGMIGHGAYSPGADNDIAVMDELGGIEFRTNPLYYSMPDYMLGLDGLEQAVNEVDTRDGQKDGRWLGNPILSYDANVRFTPAWSLYQTRRMIQLLENEGFGTDDVPDLFYVNYKAIDLAGHFWNMIEPEVRDNVIGSDAEIPKIIDWLDSTVGADSYVLAYTADHGMTPFPTETKGWSIEIRDMSEDIEGEFDTKTPNKPVILSNRGYQLMLDRKEMVANGATAEEVAEFVRNYRIRDNITPTNQVLPRFEGRTDERLYLTALTNEELDEAIECSEDPESQAALPRRSRHASLATRQRKTGFPTT